MANSIYPKNQKIRFSEFKKLCYDFIKAKIPIKGMEGTYEKATFFCIAKAM